MLDDIIVNESGDLCDPVPNRWCKSVALYAAPGG